MPEEIEEQRRIIDAVDKQLLELLARRLHVCRLVGEIKVRDQIPLRDPIREKRLFDSWSQIAAELDLSRPLAATLLTAILRASRRVQRKADDRPCLRVGYRGLPGAYAEEALLRWVRESGDIGGEALGFRSLEGLAAGLNSAEIDRAVFPSRNSIAGAVPGVAAILESEGFRIRGEVDLEVQHCLAAAEAVQPREILRVHSHPMAFEQCSRYLATLGTPRLEACADTASAALFVGAASDSRAAALCSERAALRNGLVVLARDLANATPNRTRFVIVSRD